VIIGLCGKAGTGKSTVAQIITKQFGFKELSFAETLKEICAYIFNGELKYFTDPTLKQKQFKEFMQLSNLHLESLQLQLGQRNIFVTIGQIRKWKKILKDQTTIFTCPRDILQFVGTELMRNVVGQNVHVKLLENRLNPFEDFVISDVRFDNEGEMIKKLGGKIIEILGTGVIAPKDDKHASEKGIKVEFIDRVNFNDKSLPIGFLELEVLKLIKNLMPEKIPTRKYRK
jgi:hypothetical protein